ncbi:MAG: lysylphosphatidylglycerol synthase transmembrane domain-containing protein [Candidatus Omnitrophota bacterium]
MTAKIKAFISFFLRFGLSAGLLGLLFLQMKDKERLAELFLAADFQYLVYAFLLFALIHYLLLIRWRIFINALDLNIPWMNMSRYFFLGLFGNLFLPSAIGGDIIKAVGLCVNAEKKPRIVASVLLDRLSGFASMVIVASFGLLVGFDYLDNPAIWLMVFFMALGLIFLAAVLLNQNLYNIFCQIFCFFPKIRTAVMQMHYDVVLLKDRKDAIVKAIALACAGQVLLALVFFLLALGMHQSVSIFFFIIFTPITCVAASLPSIGGLGFREGMLEYLLAGVGLVSGVGVGIGLLDFLFMVIVGIFGWFFFLLTKDRESVESASAPAS